MKKSLGGDRLGSGKKMDVELHNYGRSTHDLGYIYRTTMAPGTLVPFMCEVALPGDTFDINLHMDGKTLPTVGPMFGGFKAQHDIFIAPVRLYQGALHNNKLGIGMNMSQVKLPVYKITPNEVSDEGINWATPYDIDNVQINPSCILSYLGLRGVGLRNEAATDKSREFNAVPLLAYWEIYKNYYANKQEGIGSVIHTPGWTFVENTTDLEIGGNTIGQTPPGTFVAMGLITQGGTFEITKTAATEQPLRDIMLGVNSDGIDSNIEEWINLADIGVITGETATTVNGTFYKENGTQRFVVRWRYTNNQDVANIEREVEIETFDLEAIDEMRESLLAATGSTAAVEIVAAGAAGSPYKLLFEGGEGAARSMQSSQEGLGLKTYQSDLFNNWLSTEWIDGVNGISEITAVDTSGGSFTMDTLNLAKKVYDMLNRIAVSGGSYDDWLDAVYTNERYTRCESPMYMGGLIKEMEFQEVVSNSEAGEGSGSQPLGTLAGKGVMGKKHKGGNVTIKVDEPSYVIGIVSLTPRIDYSQGNKWDVNLKTMDDFHKPALDEIGFQELITEQMAWWDTWQDVDGTWITKSAGKQPAWINYMTNYNRVFGNFAIKNKEMYMVLNRRYDAVRTSPLAERWTIGDLTTYIDPRKYNYMFAQTSLDSQNFWVQIAVDMTVRRKISARLMPNL